MVHFMPADLADVINDLSKELARLDLELAEKAGILRIFTRRGETGTGHGAPDRPMSPIDVQSMAKLATELNYQTGEREGVRAIWHGLNSLWLKGKGIESDFFRAGQSRLTTA